MRGVSDSDLRLQRRRHDSCGSAGNQSEHQGAEDKEFSQSNPHMVALFMPKDSSGACDCDHYVTKKCAPGDDRVNPESSNRDTPLHRQRQAERDGALR